MKVSSLWNCRIQFRNCRQGLKIVKKEFVHKNFLKIQQLKISKLQRKGTFLENEKSSVQYSDDKLAYIRACIVCDTRSNYKTPQKPSTDKYKKLSEQEICGPL